MAEVTGTNLTVSDSTGETGGSDAENKSGFMDTLGSADMVRQMALVVVLVICVAIAIFILLWAATCKRMVVVFTAPWHQGQRRNV